MSAILTAEHRRQLQRPILLQPDNFTPQQRTPWAGYQISRQLKGELLEWQEDRLIGEAWEFSAGPEYPSRLLQRGSDFSPNLPPNLQDLFEQYGELIGGATPNCELLIKLLGPSSPLSVQVHPPDNYQRLKVNECGKPETWLVLHAAPDAGLYLGLKRPMAPAAFERMIRSGEDLEGVLQFVPVKAGDYFEIALGVMHAIGPDVTLLEPQRVLANQRGKTYRLWDWNRRYNENGHLVGTDDEGQARPLHIDEALPLIDTGRQFGQAYLKSLRRKLRRNKTIDGIMFSSFPANDYYQVHTLGSISFDQLNLDVPSTFDTNLERQGTSHQQLKKNTAQKSKESNCHLEVKKAYSVLTVVSGSVIVDGVRIPKGQTCLLPVRQKPYSTTCSVHTLATIVSPCANAIDIAPDSYPLAK